MSRMTQDEEKFHLPAQINTNNGISSEDDDQCIGNAQSEPRCKFYQKPMERLEKGCAQEISLQFDRAGTFSRGSLELNFPNHDVISC